MTGPFSLSRRLRRRRGVRRPRRPRARSRPGAQRRGEGAGRRGGRAAPARRAVPRGLPRARRAGHRGPQHRGRGRAGDVGAARLLRQPLRPPAVGGTLTSCSRRSSTPPSTSSSWSSPQGRRRPGVDREVPLGPGARRRRAGRQDARGRVGRARRATDRAGVGLRAAGAAARDTRLRAAPPARACRPRQAQRHDDGGRGGARRLVDGEAGCDLWRRFRPRSRRSRRTRSCGFCATAPEPGQSRTSPRSTRRPRTAAAVVMARSLARARRGQVPQPAVGVHEQALAAARRPAPARCAARRAATGSTSAVFTSITPRPSTRSQP